MSTVHSQFPQELVDQVIDFLYDDPQSLKACFLGIRVFSNFVQSQNCTFLHHIRTITASRLRWHPDDHYFDTLAPELGRLAGVHAFEMNLNTMGDATTVDIVTASLLSFTAAFTHVTRLVLVCNFHPTAEPAQLLSMISHFAALQELCMRRGLIHRTMIPLTAPSSNVAPPPELSSLTFGIDAVNPVLTWFRASNNLPHVRSLVLPDSHVEGSWDIFARALPLIGGNLHHLSISLSQAPRDFIPDFSLNAILRTLVMRDCMWMDAGRISNLVAPGLEHLTIELYSPQAAIDPHLWLVLDAHLSAAKFPQLRKVLLRCKIRAYGRFLQETFVSLRASGVLQVEPDPEDLLAVGFLEPFAPEPPPLLPLLLG